MTGAPSGAARNGEAKVGRAALRHGSLALIVVVALGLIVAVLRAAGPVSLADAFRQGALVPAVVHRVPVDVGPVTIRFALLLVTAGAGWLLFRGGRAVAHDGRAAFRAVSGAAVAVPYAAGSLLVTLAALGVSPIGRASGGAVPSIPGSFGWPLLLGALCGAAGGISAGPPAGRVERRLRAAVAGGWRMTWLSVALGTTGVLVVLALNPIAVRAYLDGAFGRGPAVGALAVVGTVTALPNVGTGAAAAAMGSGIELEALGASCTVISYTRFPGGEGTTAGPCGRLPFAIGSTPAGYLLFLLVPLAGTVAGGRVAAGRCKGGWGESVLLGAAAGLPFAVAFGGWCVASRLVYEATGPASALVSDLRVAAGPDPLAAFLFGLVWGPAGGALGGWWMARTRRKTPAGPDDPGPARDEVA